ncbi:hypothetical protein [Tenacibaculum sp. 190524A05c]|uniref:hypothetical protein n=1 Tax=Tenacibaculum platacis TaxID=3137852 RepID=UPI0032B1ADD6
MKDTQELMQKVKNAIKFLFLLIFIVSCSSYKNYDTNNDMEEILSLLSEKQSIYYKTIDEDLKQSLDTYINLNDFDFDLCTDSKEVITKEELKIIKQKTKNLNRVNLKRMYPSVDLKIKKESLKISFISYPILFRQNKAAIYHKTGTYGGSFNLLIKKQNKWTFACSKSIWIE